MVLFTYSNFLFLRCSLPTPSILELLCLKIILKPLKTERESKIHVLWSHCSESLKVDAESVSSALDTLWGGVEFTLSGVPLPRLCLEAWTGWSEKHVLCVFPKSNHSIIIWGGWWCQNLWGGLKGPSSCQFFGRSGRHYVFFCPRQQPEPISSTITQY